jgi:hypothetical protein
MLLVVSFLLLPKIYLEGLVFHHHLEVLIIALIILEAQVILLLLVFNFVLEVNLKVGDNLKLGDNPKLGVIIQFTGSIHLDYQPSLGIFLSKVINNFLGGGNPQFNSFVPSNPGQPYLGTVNPTWGQAFQSNAPFQVGMTNQPTKVGYLTQNPP